MTMLSVSRSDTQELVRSIVAKLDKAKEIRPNTWQACCPAHDDKSPSFRLTLTDDGQVLMHCFAGCTPDEICSSLGVSMSSLFPDSDRTYYPVKSPVNIPTEDAFLLR